MQPYKNKMCKKLLKAISLENLQPYKAAQLRVKVVKRHKNMEVLCLLLPLYDFYRVWELLADFSYFYSYKFLLLQFFNYKSCTIFFTAVNIRLKI
jgi:hypothetical protein